MEGVPTFNRKMAKPPEKKHQGAAEARATLMVLEDFTVDDVYEVLVRNGLYLPNKCHWLSKKMMV